MWESNDLYDLRVAGTSIAWKHLEIGNCENFESIEVSAPNLVSFYIDGFHLLSFILENVPKLIEVSFHGSLMRTQKMMPSTCFHAVILS